MKLCCVNYERVFTRYEKGLIEKMEQLVSIEANRNWSTRELNDIIQNYRNDLTAFEASILENMDQDEA